MILYVVSIIVCIVVTTTGVDCPPNTLKLQYVGEGGSKKLSKSVYARTLDNCIFIKYVLPHRKEQLGSLIEFVTADYATLIIV